MLYRLQSTGNFRKSVNCGFMLVEELYRIPCLYQVWLCSAKLVSGINDVLLFNGISWSKHETNCWAMFGHIFQYISYIRETN